MTPLLILLAPLLALAEELQSCGEAPYFPSEYTCFDDSVLCPVALGLVTRPCGGACYAEQMYRCEDSSLRLLPAASRPFALTAHSTSGRVDGLRVKACGGYLAIGADARECTSCPEGVDCAGYENRTVLLAGGEMAAEVGQYWYVNATDGSLMFTVGDEAGASLAGKGVTVYENGFFAHDGQAYWLSCLRTLPGGTLGTGKTRRIYAATDENRERTGCEAVKLVASAVDRKQGAYQYE